MDTLFRGLAIIADLAFSVGLVWLIINAMRKKDIGTPLKLIGSGIIAMFIFGLIGAQIDKWQTPKLDIASRKVKITGTHSKATLVGKTSPNVKVNVKETDTYYHMNKTVKSDDKGDFKVTGLRDTSKFRVTAINDDHKSKPVTIKTGDIPDSAYAKLHVDHHDVVFETNVDANRTATITGTATPNSKVEFYDSESDIDLKTNSDSAGKWKITIKMPANKRKCDVDISVRHKGLQDNTDGLATLINKNVATKSSKASSSSSDSDDPTKGFDAFKLDLDTYMDNAWSEITYTIDKTRFITFTAPETYKYASKTAKQEMADEIYRHVFMFSDVAKLKDEPHMEIQTQSGWLLAREKVLGGMKVYGSDD